ncbi:MAG: hypothetical protein ACYTF0_00150 [Planctomycetota bacterium]
MASTDSRLPYRAPRLIHHGDLRQLTHHHRPGHGGGPGSGGGGPGGGSKGPGKNDGVNSRPSL